MQCSMPAEMIVLFQGELHTCSVACQQKYTNNGTQKPLELILPLITNFTNIISYSWQLGGAHAFHICWMLCYVMLCSLGPWLNTVSWLASHFM